MYIVVVWTGGRETGSPDIFGPFPTLEAAVEAAGRANQEWQWPCLATEMRLASELLALPEWVPTIAATETVR